MTKLDLKQQWRELYQASAKQPALVQVPAFNYLTVDGVGDPNTSSDFQRAMEAVYGLAYTLKFAAKAAGADFTVMPLEGLWWVEDLAEFSFEARGNWRWTLLLALPDSITAERVEAAREQVARKKASPLLEQIRLERWEEGLAAQVMHVGPYATEPETVERLHAFAAEQGYELRGNHHEIYLGDPRRTAPEKLPTILRHPVAPR